LEFLEYFDKREAVGCHFHTDELQRIVTSPLFSMKKAERIKPSRYTVQSALPWICLIALYSGMRLDEICSLRTFDLEQHNKKWFLVVAEEGERGVKSEAAERKVPVHSKLVRFGFITYAKALPRGQMFPALTPGGPDRKLSWQVSQRFATLRKGPGITRARLAFHSFRKNVTTALDNAGISQADVAALIGHERGFTFDTYSGGKGLQALRGIVEKIKYPGLRLDHLYI
jgi:integrase